MRTFPRPTPLTNTHFSGARRRRARARRLARPAAAALALLLPLAIATPSQATPTFIGLGGVPATSSDGLSADGLFVVGTVSPGFRAFLWSDDGLDEIGPIPSRFERSQALGVSADGGTVVGVLDPQPFSEEPRPFMWTEASFDLLPELPGGTNAGIARGISDDGSTIVGWGTSDAGMEATVWTQATPVGLGSLPGTFAYSSAWATTADGSTVVGVAGTWNDEPGVIDGFCEAGCCPVEGAVGEAFRHVDDQMEGLGHLPGGGAYSAALGVSPDGQFIVGESDATGDVCEAFLWSDGQLIGLGHLPGGTISSAFDVSADGRIVVGESLDEFAQYRAFIWDADNGMRSLQQVMVDEYDLPVGDWATILSARGISDDGNTITGFGINADGDFEAFVVRMAPSPSRALLQLTAIAALTGLTRTRSTRTTRR